jgi:hypothetical protein
LLWSLAYLAVRAVLGLVVLAARSGRSKDLEILVLRQSLPSFGAGRPPELDPCGSRVLGCAESPLATGGMGELHRAAQQARNLIMQLGDERPLRTLIHDRDSKFSGGFDEIFRCEGVNVIKTPVRAPNANAYAERWVRTVRADCLDHLLVVGCRQLERALRVYVRHYNEHRPHHALGLTAPDRPVEVPAAVMPLDVRRRDLLGGLIHEYRIAA